MSFEGKIMSKNKYATAFLHQIEAILFILLQIVSATSTALTLEERAYSIFDAFSPIMCKQKSYAPYN